MAVTAKGVLAVGFGRTDPIANRRDIDAQIRRRATIADLARQTDGLLLEFLGVRAPRFRLVCGWGGGHGYRS
jgi:hypothetical protein